MRRNAQIALLAVLVAGAFLATSAIYTVSEVEQMIITQFGKPVGAPVTSAGLKAKLPFIQEVNPIDKRVLEWDGSPSGRPLRPLADHRSTAIFSAAARRTQCPVSP
jgi:membrane protease subunit HflC